MLFRFVRLAAEHAAKLLDPRRPIESLDRRHRTIFLGRFGDDELSVATRSHRGQMSDADGLQNVFGSSLTP